jgi:hypothetical protein
MEIERRLCAMYEAFNARDIESVLRQMAAEVQWPNAWEGGWVEGKAGVRAYWTRQWAEIDPKVQPLNIDVQHPSRAIVEVHQLVRDLDGTLLSEGRILHVYTIDAGLIVRMDVLRTAADQRRALVATLRELAQWRAQKAHEFGDNPVARKASVRAKHALRTLANFVEAMSDDDPELLLYALRRVEAHNGRLRLTPESITTLSRFGIRPSAWQAPQQTEAQMRKILRRIDGIEAKERYQRKLGDW